MPISFEDHDELALTAFCLRDETDVAVYDALSDEDRPKYRAALARTAAYKFVRLRSTTVMLIAEAAEALRKRKKRNDG